MLGWNGGVVTGEGGGVVRTELVMAEEGGRGLAWAEVCWLGGGAGGGGGQEGLSPHLPRGLQKLMRRNVLP